MMRLILPGTLHQHSAFFFDSEQHLPFQENCHSAKCATSSRLAYLAGLCQFMLCNFQQ